MNTVDPGGVNQQCQPGADQQSTVLTQGGSMINTVDPWGVNQQSTQPESTEAIIFSCESESSLLILSTSIVNPPQINRGDCLFT